MSKTGPIQQCKARGFVVDKHTGQPLPGVVVVALAQPDTAGVQETVLVPLSMLVSDAAGYVSFDWRKETSLNQFECLWLCANGDETVKINLTNLWSGNEVGYRFLLKVDAKLAKPSYQQIKLPSIQNPDLIDWEISPYSFSVKSELLLGEEGCEVLVQSTEAEREYRFTQVVRKTTLQADPSNTQPPDYLRLSGQTPGQAVSQSISLLDPNADFKKLPDSMEIFYGEILEFKQTWKPKGHALGAILYSTALAPCESVSIAVIDWARKDEIMRADAIVSNESLSHSQRRERIIDESVLAAIHESQGGWSLMGGHGGAMAATIPIETVQLHVGGTHAIGGAITKSWGNRDLTADSVQNLHDTILQATNITRSLNSTVIVQATQEERNYLETRTITNHNHCHALTIQYYEVVRHFKVVTEYVQSRSAVLLPYKLIDFSSDSVLRYRTILETVLLDPTLQQCFDAIVRLHYCSGIYGTSSQTTQPSETKTGETSLPSGTTPLYRLYNQEVDDHFYTTNSAEAENAQKENDYVSEGIACYVFSTPVAGTTPLYRLYNQEVDDHFYTTNSAEAENAQKENDYVSEGIACHVFDSNVISSKNTASSNADFSVSNIRFRIKRGQWGTESKPLQKTTSVRLLLKKKDGTYVKFLEEDGTETERLAVYDSGIENEYQQTQEKWLDWHKVRLSLPVKRSEFAKVQIEWQPHWSTTKPKWSFRGLNLRAVTPQGDQTIFFGEQTNDLEADDDSWERVKSWEKPVNSFDPSSGPNKEKQPKFEEAVSEEADECCEKQLIQHLNDNIGFYNRAIWLLQDPTERVMMLNVALAQYPDILDRMDTAPIAVSGNYVAFPYNDQSPNEQKDKTRRTNNPPQESIISIPTRGMFAETHLSHCNACEVRDVTRFWQWDESPCEKPPAIEGITPGPRGQPSKIEPTTLPSPVVQIMQPPAAPDPVGLAAALNLLGQPNIFRDMSAVNELQDLLSGLASGAVDLVKGQQQLEAIKQKLASQAKGGGGSGSSQTPEERYDNLQVAKEFAKSAEELGIDEETKGEVSRDMVEGGGGFWSNVREMVEQGIMGAKPTGGGLAGAGAAVGEKGLDVIGGEIGKIFEVGNFTILGPQDGAAVILANTDPDDYDPPGPLGDHLYTFFIFLKNLGKAGMGDGLNAMLEIDWIDDCRLTTVKGTGPLAQWKRNIRFKKGITIVGSGSAGNAIAQAQVTLNIVKYGVDSKVEPARALAAMKITITIIPKTTLGTPLVGQFLVPIDPVSNVDYEIEDNNVGLASFVVKKKARP